MPKIVDHDARRRELVDIAWKVIARDGVEGATLRELAAEAGYSNGAIKPYFPTKDSLFEATFAHVFDRTGVRVQRQVRGLSGWEALQAFAREVLPLQADSRDEARVVVAYWALAAQSPETAALMVTQRAQWRRWLTDWMGQAMAAGQVRAGLSLSACVDAFLTFFEGSQVVGVMDPGAGEAEQLWGQFQAMVMGWRLETA